MARLARVIAVGIPHHVTQRGNARRHILGSDADRLVYLSLLREYVALCQLSLGKTKKAEPEPRPSPGLRLNAVNRRYFRFSSGSGFA